MSTIQLEKTPDSLSKIITVDEEQKTALFSKYSGMDDIEVIKELSQIAYRMLGTNHELYDYALTVIRNINPKICPSIEEMKSILTKMFSNEVEGNMSLEENHKLVNESLVKFTTLFNQCGIDYYIL